MPTFPSTSYPIDAPASSVPGAGPVILGAVVAVVLIALMIIFTYYYKKRVLDPHRPVSGGFMAGVYDETYGGHSEGSDLILWRELGGTRHRMVPLADADIGSMEKGTFRLVFQQTSASGRNVGPSMVSAEPVPRDLAASVCGRTELTGNLSVHTPDGDDALALMADATGSAPTEFSFCIDIFGNDFRNYRRTVTVRGSPIRGSMCLFGRELVHDDGDPLSKDLNMDFVCGFHEGEEGHIVLSTDLGSDDVEVEDLHGAPTEDMVGRYYLLLDFTPLGLPKVGIPGISSEPISHGTAVRIASDTIRNGALNVYCPRREDALELCREVIGGREPSECRLSDDPVLTVSYLIDRKDRGKAVPRIMFGDAVVDADPPSDS